MSHPLPWAQATYFENRVCSGFRVSPCGRWPCFRITSISPIFHSIDINSAFQFRRGLYSSIQEAGCGSKGRCGTQEAHPWCGKGWGKEWAQETGQGQTSWQLGRPGRLTVFLGSRPLHIPFVSIILNSVLCDFVCFLDQNPSQSTLSKCVNWGAICILKWQYNNVPNWVAELVEPLASLLATILKLWMGIIGKKDGLLTGIGCFIWKWSLKREGRTQFPVLKGIIPCASCEHLSSASFSLQNVQDLRKSK